MEQALYELPEGWRRQKLGELCELENGDRGKNYPSRSTFIDSGIPVINAGNLTDTGIDKLSLNYISRDRFDLIGGGKIRENDLLFCLRGSLGKSAIVKGISEGAIASSLVIVRPKLLMVNEYLKAYFDSHLCAGMIEHYDNGTAQPNLSAGNLKKFPIPLPPLNEQKRIVAKLDALFTRIDTAITHLQQNLELSKALFVSVLDEVFQQTYNQNPIEKLSKLTLKIGSGATPKGGQKSYKTEGISLIRSLNVHDAWFKKKGLAYIDDMQASLLSNVEVKSGDVLLNITGASVARSCIVPDEYLPARVNQHVSILRPKDELDTVFLNYLIISPNFKNDLLFQGAGGATRRLSENDAKSMSPYTF